MRGSPHHSGMTLVVPGGLMTSAEHGSRGLVPLEPEARSDGKTGWLPVIARGREG